MCPNNVCVHVYYLSKCLCVNCVLQTLLHTLYTLHTIAECISWLDVCVDVAWVPQQFYRQFDADSVCVVCLFGVNE